MDYSKLLSKAMKNNEKCEAEKQKLLKLEKQKQLEAKKQKQLNEEALKRYIEAKKQKELQEKQKQEYLKRVEEQKLKELKEKKEAEKKKQKEELDKEKQLNERSKSTMENNNNNNKKSFITLSDHSSIMRQKHFTHSTAGSKPMDFNQLMEMAKKNVGKAASIHSASDKEDTISSISSDSEDDALPPTMKYKNTNQNTPNLKKVTPSVLSSNATKSMPYSEKVYKNSDKSVSKVSTIADSGLLKRKSDPIDYGSFKKLKGSPAIYSGVKSENLNLKISKAHKPSKTEPPIPKSSVKSAINNHYNGVKHGTLANSISSKNQTSAQNGISNKNNTIKNAISAQSNSSKSGILAQSNSSKSGILAQSNSSKSGILAQSNSSKSGILAQSNSSKSGILAQSNSSKGGILAQSNSLKNGMSGHSGTVSNNDPKVRVSNLKSVKPDLKGNSNDDVSRKSMTSRKELDKMNGIRKIKSDTKREIPVKRSMSGIMAQSGVSVSGILAQNNALKPGILAQFGVNRSSRDKRQDHEDEDDYSYDDEDEYEDDFIDDSEEVNGESYAEYVKSIHESLRFDPSKYAKVRPDDDCRNMEATFKDVEKEEKRSLRIGRKEDLEDIRREEEEKLRKKKKQTKMNVDK